MRPRTLDEEEESMERGMMKKMGGADDWRQKQACHFYALKGKRGSGVKCSEGKEEA